MKPNVPKNTQFIEKCIAAGKTMRDNFIPHMMLAYDSECGHGVTVMYSSVDKCIPMPLNYMTMAHCLLGSLLGSGTQNIDAFRRVNDDLCLVKNVVNASGDIPEGSDWDCTDIFDPIHQTLVDLHAESPGLKFCIGLACERVSVADGPSIVIISITADPAAAAERTLCGVETDGDEFASLSAYCGVLKSMLPFLSMSSNGVQASRVESLEMAMRSIANAGFPLVSPDGWILTTPEGSEAWIERTMEAETAADFGEVFKQDKNYMAIVTVFNNSNEFWRTSVREYMAGELSHSSDNIYRAEYIDDVIEYFETVEQCVPTGGARG